ncbi:MAG: excinuclease ABC subunit B [Candidatus Portnoybacteria bacterium CG_4_8_14_3_um_filter_44_10]|uniref:Excinuclease ABC subunit B n=3 Tax=Candidatus Portnoyibacteriota TaxID=1817913 RepID=A0A2H0WW13_9BACT|nr:MAG: excinuclease ABC subunit B [Candidatus Portnoybacteria bacterium CG09_land_8_20_14_0_10_44_13]PIW75657.1 MAG: excinuclease ABC subunit B [Candidatus Portnoybacteria bacterium CG_4_8_14_3_um_filter_44_10]PIZ69025.1 MAG: excinuclease ABC subunit B [Candidatus Portnoybacteria bacterium CG_4_10_14_0_2_um_filter_44_20]
MFKLTSKFKPAGDQPKAIKKLISGLDKDCRFQTLRGVTGSGKTFAMANVLASYKKPVLVISPNKALAAQLYHEYKNFFKNNTVCYFVSYYDYYQPEAYIPITDTYIEKEAMINEEIDRLRHQATSALMRKKDVIVVASVSCIYNLGVPSNYFQSAIHLELGKPITREDLIRQMIKIHFERTNTEVKRGYFRVRGDVFELIPASGEVINRIELKDQKISELAIVDSATRRITQQLKELAIFPIKHFVTTEPERERAIKDISTESKARVKFFEKRGRFLDAERILRRTKNDLSMIKTLGYCHGIENYSRHLVGKLPGEPPDTLLSYFPWRDGKPDFLTIIDESHIAVPQIRGMFEGDKSRKGTLIEYGFRLPSALDNRPLKFNEFLERTDKIIFTSATPGPYELQNSKQITEMVIRPTYLADPEIEIRPVFDKKKNRSQIDDIIEEINKLAKKNERMIVNTLTKKTAEELSDFLISKKIKAQFMHSETKTLERTKILTDFRRGVYDVLVGVNLLREGLDLPEVSTVAILDADREGFLRSETSLIQLMGRAARNVRGKIVLYADVMTSSIKNAVRHADRIRQIQLAHNKKRGLTPRGIKKEVEELIKIGE